MLIVFIRTVILYIVVLITVRLMGKAELSKMSPFQLVIIFMMSELATIPIDSPDKPIWMGILAIFTLLLLQRIISFLSLKSEGFKNVVNGRPSILIDNGRINEKALKSLRISINDLMEQLRLGGSPSITDVDYAVLESNGNLSIILKPENQPLTRKDAKLNSAPQTMPAVVVSDGTLYDDNLKLMGYDEKYLEKRLQKLGIDSYKNVFLVFGDEQRRLHIYNRNKDGSLIEELSQARSDNSGS